MPQLGQGFLQPHIRLGTSKPQRRHFGRGRGAGTFSSLKPKRPGQKRIGEPLDPDRGIWSVPAMNDGRIWQREKLRLDRRHERGRIAAGEIGSADRAVEQHVATEDPAMSDKTHAAWRVARRMANLERQSAETELLTNRQLDIRRRGRIQTHSHPCAKLRQRIIQPAIERMEMDRHPRGLLHRGHADDMVDMGVRQPNRA